MNKTSTIRLGGIPVTKAKYDMDCSWFVYANGYDYAQGIQEAHSHKIRIGVHKIN